MIFIWQTNRAKSFQKQQILTYKYHHISIHILGSKVWNCHPSTQNCSLNLASLGHILSTWQVAGISFGRPSAHYMGCFRCGPAKQKRTHLEGANWGEHESTSTIDSEIVKCILSELFHFTSPVGAELSQRENFVQSQVGGSALLFSNEIARVGRSLCSMLLNPFLYWHSKLVCFDPFMTPNWSIRSHRFNFSNFVRHQNICPVRALEYGTVSQ